MPDSMNKIQKTPGATPASSAEDTKIGASKARSVKATPEGKHHFIVGNTIKSGISVAKGLADRLTKQKNNQSDATKLILNIIKQYQQSNDVKHLQTIIDTLTNLNDEEKKNLNTNEISQKVMTQFHHHVSKYLDKSKYSIVALDRIERRFNTDIKCILVLLGIEDQEINDFYSRIIGDHKNKADNKNHDEILSKLLSNIAKNSKEIQEIVVILNKENIAYNNDEFNKSLLGKFFEDAKNVIDKPTNIDKINSIENNYTNFVIPILGLTDKNGESKIESDKNMQNIRNDVVNKIMKNQLQEKIKLIDSDWLSESIKDLQEKFTHLPPNYRSILCEKIRDHFASKLPKNQKQLANGDYIKALKKEFDIIFKPVLLSIDDDSLYIGYLEEIIKQTSTSVDELKNSLNVQRIKIIHDKFINLIKNEISFNKQDFYQSIVSIFVESIQQDAATSTDYSLIKDINTAYNNYVVPVLEAVSIDKSAAESEISQGINLAKTQIANNYIKAKLPNLLKDSTTNEKLDEIKQQISMFSKDGINYDKDLIEEFLQECMNFKNNVEQVVGNIRDVEKIKFIEENISNKVNNYLSPVLSSLNCDPMVIQAFNNSIRLVFNYQEIKGQIKRGYSSDIVNKITDNLNNISNINNKLYFENIKNLLVYNHKTIAKVDKENIYSKIVEKYSSVIDNVFTNSNNFSESLILINDHFEDSVSPLLDKDIGEKYKKQLKNLIKDKFTEHVLARYNNVDFDALTSLDEKQKIITCMDILLVGTEINKEVKQTAVRIIREILKSDNTDTSNIKLIFSCVDNQIKKRDNTSSLQEIRSFLEKVISDNLILSIPEKVKKDPEEDLAFFKSRMMFLLSNKILRNNKNLIYNQVKNRFLNYAQLVMSKAVVKNKSISMDKIEYLYMEYIEPILNTLNKNSQAQQDIRTQLTEIARKNKINKTFLQLSEEINNQYTRISSSFSRVSNEIDNIVTDSKNQLAIKNRIDSLNARIKANSKTTILDVVKILPRGIEKLIRLIKERFSRKISLADTKYNEYSSDITAMNNNIIEYYKRYQNSEYADKIVGLSPFRNTFVAEQLQENKFPYYMVGKTLKNNSSLFTEDQRDRISETIEVISHSIAEYKHNIKDKSLKIDLLFEHVLHKTIINMINSGEYRSHDDIGKLILTNYKKDVTNFCVDLRQIDSKVLKSGFTKLDLEALNSEKDSDNFSINFK